MAEDLLNKRDIIDHYTSEGKGMCEQESQLVWLQSLEVLTATLKSLLVLFSISYHMLVACLQCKPALMMVFNHLYATTCGLLPSVMLAMRY